MRLPGTRYQEHGWEQVRKLLGHCSLQVLGPAQLATLDAPGALDAYVAAMARSLAMARADAHGNSYGESVQELALGLLFELQARPGDWLAFCRTIEPGLADAALRKRVNDMYAVLRDKVDADNYQVACGRPCSANRIYTYRMLDMAHAEVARILGDWSNHREQAGAILGRPLGATPIESRALQSIAQCRAEWIIRWSETLERYGDGPGPLHTKSKRFSSLKNQPEAIQAMLAEIGEYETLSANRDADWLQDEHDADAWLDDLARVLHESEQGEDVVSASPRLGDTCGLVARAMDGAALPVRLAVYKEMLGSADDSYPADWLDPATGELPTMQQLAEMGQLSLPTLRKRRDEIIVRLRGA